MQLKSYFLRETKTWVPSLGLRVKVCSASNDCVGSNRKSNFCNNFASTITPSSFYKKKRILIVYIRH